MSTTAAAPAGKIQPRLKQKYQAEIKTQLQEVLDMQDVGKNNMTIKLKKKALQGARAA